MGTTKVEKNLWLATLFEQKRGFRKLVSNKSVLVVGDNGTGKSSLIAKLQGRRPPKYGGGLEFGYIDVEDESNGDKTQLVVWILDGDAGHTNLLPIALNENNLGEVLVMLTVSMMVPWTWPEQLKYWINVLERHIEILPLAAEQKEAARKRLVTKWQSYCYTGSTLQPTNGCQNKEIDVDELLPLTKDALTTNIGLDLVVVVTKTDCMGAAFHMEHEYGDQHFDFMQQWIRKFCLRHGAALFYTSLKKATTCDNLQKYLFHRLYGLPFQTPPMVADQDAVLVPAGWDTLKKIDILTENIPGLDPDCDYTDIIKAPFTGSAIFNRDLEFVETVDEQAFLARQLEILRKLNQADAEGGGDSISRTHPTSTGQCSPTNPDPDGPLAKFFAKLMEKKPPISSSAGDGPVSESGRNDTEKLAAELDRLSSSIKKKKDQKKPK